MSLITAADLAAAKTGTNLPGSFNVTHPATPAPKPSTPARPTAAPSPTPTSAPAGNSTTGGGYYYDPAAAAAAAAQAQAQSDYNSSKDATFGSINDAINSGASGYNSSILDYLDSLKSSQGAINNKAVQNELSRSTGTAGVLDMVGHGIRSGGVTLANDNASNSSAADALAKAYGDIGRRQLSGVGNQYELGKSDIAQSQTALDQANSTELRHASENKTNIINSIVSQATDKLSALNAAAASASLPDRLDIESQKSQIQQQALSALQQYDQALSSGISGNAPTSVEANRATAAGLASAGTAPDDAFNYTTDVPANLQSTGPFASELPIFTLPSKKQTA